MKSSKIAGIKLAEKFVPRAKGERFTRSQVGIVEGMKMYFQKNTGIEIRVLSENKYLVIAPKSENKNEKQKEFNCVGVGEVERICYCIQNKKTEKPNGISWREYFKTSVSTHPNTVGLGYEILLPVSIEPETKKPLFRTLKNIYLESANWFPKNYKFQEPKLLSFWS